MADTHSPSLYAPALRGFLAALGGDAVLKGAGTLAALIVLHELSPYDYGFWQLLLSVVTAFAIFIFPGIASMLIADISRELGAHNEARAASIALYAAGTFVSLGALGALAMLIAAPFIREFSGINIVSLVQLLAISVFALSVRQVYQMLLSSRLMFVHSQTIRAIERLTYLASVFVFLVVLDKGFAGVAYAYVIASVTPLIVYAPYIARMLLQAYRVREVGDASPFVDAVFARGRWVLGTDAINAVLGSLWPWVIGYYLGVEAVGFIGVALLLLGQVAALVPITYVLRAILPRTLDSTERTKEWLSRSMKFSLWGHLAAGTIVFVATLIIFPLWFPQHVPAIALYAALLLSLPLRGVSTTAAEWFVATKRQRDLFLITTLPKTIMFALLPVFLFTGGVIGYVLWYLINSDLIVYARLRLIRRHLNLESGMRYLLRFDAVDSELVERAYVSIRGRLVRIFA